jgi:tRNA nucleotidyltransferase (CCA-adding enzyme)
VRTLLWQLVSVAERNGLSLYLVGGPVRDVLLGQPPDDLDLVVEGDAPALAREAAKEVGGQVLAHSRFGTATVKLGDIRLDLATARTETYARPGALPQVRAGTLQQDLIRRDFTINAMAVPLSGTDKGRLVDPFGGQQDLRDGLVRVLHDRSFVDDPTRILRGIRYEQRLGSRFEEGTLRLLHEALDRRCLSTVTGDRLRHELQRMLEEPGPLKPLLRARELGVFAGLYPALRDAPYLPRLEGKHVSDPLAYLATLAYGLDPKYRAGFIFRLNMPSRWEKVVSDAVALSSMESHLADAGMPPLELCRKLDPLSEASLQAGLLVMDDGVARDNLARYANELRYVKPLLNGDDLLLLGIPEGPMIGEALEMLRVARLEGRARTRRDEVALVREWMAGRA